MTIIDFKNQSRSKTMYKLQRYYIQGGPFITANLYCICLSEHETCAFKQVQYRFAVIYETPSSVYRVNTNGYGVECSLFNLQGEKTVISGIFIVFMATRIIENLRISDL